MLRLYRGPLKALRGLVHADARPPIYDWFTKSFDTADLKDAKALLEELK